MRYYVLKREFSRVDHFSLTVINAKNKEEAWNKCEEELSSTNSQEWLLTKSELDKLINLMEIIYAARITETKRS